MTTIADKAKEYAEEQIFANRDILTEIKLETIEYLTIKAYLAGHEEAVKWKDVNKELPEIDEHGYSESVLVCRTTIDKGKSYHIAKYDDRYKSWLMENNRYREDINFWRHID